MDILAGLPMMAGAVTRQISAENPTGEKGGACRWAPDPTNPDIPYSKHSVDLGKGWKVRPFVPVEAGETLLMADIEGPDHSVFRGTLVSHKSPPRDKGGSQW